MRTKLIMIMLMFAISSYAEIIDSINIDLKDNYFKIKVKQNFSLITDKYPVQIYKLTFYNNYRKIHSVKHKVKLNSKEKTLFQLPDGCNMVKVGMK